MNRILRCHWLPERVRWSYLVRSGYGAFTMFWCFIPFDKSFIAQVCSVKMAGYWPRFCVFIHAKNEAKAISISTQKKKNEANIQPSITPKDCIDESAESSGTFPRLISSPRCDGSISQRLLCLCRYSETVKSFCCVVSLLTFICTFRNRTIVFI